MIKKVYEVGGVEYTALFDFKVNLQGGVDGSGSSIEIECWTQSIKPTPTEETCLEILAQAEQQKEEIELACLEQFYGGDFDEDQ